MFIGRARELMRLRAEFDRPRPSLMIVYGRRRVGKSAMLIEATRDRPHVVFQATRVTQALNLEALKAETARTLGADAVLQKLGDWPGVLAWFARKAETLPALVLVLDAFPYLADVDPALASVIQKFWDGLIAANGRLKLILCGSMIAQMEDLLAERNPLYGRQTLAMDVRPLSLRDAAGFFPGYSAEDQVLAYAVFGGVPFYLRLCDPAAGIKDNVITLLLGDSGALVDEPNVLLQSEFRETQRYASILAAIADGCTKVGDISGRIREVGDSSALSPYLERLERLRLIRAVRSLDAAPKSRDRRYFITDPLIAFWHRFVRPNMSSVAQGFGAEVWAHQVAPRLDDHMGGAFEEICRQHMRSCAQERLPAPAQEIGQVWGADYDIDIAGRLLDNAMLYGECKWRRGPVSEDVLSTLIERAGRTAYGRGVDARHFVLYARTGYEASTIARARADGRVVLYTLQDMVAV